MKRALVLNSGLSWTAYQIGALRYLLIDQALDFDLYAGSGLGAINAAFAACGEFAALETFWQLFGLRLLGSFNWRAPWKTLFTGAPQRRFIAAHIHEQKLVERGATLFVSTLNLQTGREEVMTYPGNALPLQDALMAAIATCGIFPPVLYRNQQLVDATFINTFPLPTVLQQPVEEIIAVAVAIQRGLRTQRRYKTWPRVFERALHMNLAHDVWEACAEGQKTGAAAAAFRYVNAHVPARLGVHIANPELRERLLASVSAVYSDSSYALKRAKGPVLKAITPSHDLTYPLWRFRAKDLASASELGYRDARKAIEEVEVAQ